MGSLSLLLSSSSVTALRGLVGFRSSIWLPVASCLNSALSPQNPPVLSLSELSKAPVHNGLSTPLPPSEASSTRLSPPNVSALLDISLPGPPEDVLSQGEPATHISDSIIEIAIAFGETLELGSVGLLAAMLLMQLVAFPCTILMGKLAERYGTHRIIILSIVGYVCISVYAMFIVNITQFYVLAVAVGFFQGTIQALSRSYFGRMVPKDRTGEYFGILDIFGKGSTIIGTGVIAVLSSLIDDSYIVPKVLLGLFLIGLVFFLLSTRNHVYDAKPSE